MNLIDRIKKDKEVINKIDNRRDKLIFLWDYYKVPILVVILSLLIAIVTIISNIGKKPVLMYVTVLNNDSSVVEVDSNVFIDELQKAGIDVDGKEVDITDYLSLGLGNDDEDGETLQVLNALFTLTDLDLFVAPKQQFDLFAQKDGYADLSELMDQDLLNKNSDVLYKYINSEGKEIVAGIILNDDSILHKAGYYHSEVIIGVVNNSVYQENAIAFIKQVLSD